MFSSNADQIDKSKKLMYEKGIVESRGARDFQKLGSQVFYRLWKEEFSKLDFRVISDDVSSINQKQFKILGGYPGRLIVGRYPSTKLALDRDFTAVFDSQNPYRIFVGQSECSDTYIETLGGIIYVDKKGHKIDTKPFFAPVFSMDFRNGRPRTWWPESPSNINTYLCGDILMLNSFQRWDYYPTLKGVILKEDELQSKFEIQTQINYPNLNGLHLGRWMCIRRNHRKDNEDTICYDLKSFRSNESKDLIYDRVVVSAAGGGAGDNKDEASADLIATLESLEDVPSFDRTDRDGYPVKCIKCGQETVEGSFSHDSCSIYLGKAVCVHCSIRYSISNDKWECFLADPTFNRCSCHVEAPNYKCTAPHASGVKYCVDWGEVAAEKKGYQQRMSFRVIEETQT